MIRRPTLPGVVLPALPALLLIAIALPARAQEHEADPAAMKTFVEMVEAYRRRPAITVTSRITVELSQGETSSAANEVVAEISFGAGGRGRVVLNGFTIWIGDGQIRAVHEATDHSYFASADGGSPYYALMTAFVDIPYPHLAIAFGDEEIAEWLPTQFHPRAPWIRPTSVETVVREDAPQVERLVMSSDNAVLEMLIDSKSKLIETMELRITGGDAVQSGTTMTFKYKLDYETYEGLPVEAEAILAFDPGNRQAVDMLASLMPAPEPAAARPPAGGPGNAGGGAGALVGKKAPNFMLATSDGDAVDLEALEGQVVVLDFFATWCPPCVKALPELHDVARWARNQGLPVQVIPINVFELRGGEDNPDARLAKVQAFWKERRFSLPVAMDYTNETGTAYGVRGIPATFVIRSDGVVHAEYSSGAPPDFATVLKSKITEALGALEVDD